MRTTCLLNCFCLLLVPAAQAGIISYSATDGPIADGNPAGLSATAAVSDYPSSISGVTVSLDISGGYNGDLYAYLSYGGVLVPLLNRAGVTGDNASGYGNQGFNITLSSSASGAQDVHCYGNYSPSYNEQGQLTATWQPDGRRIDPQSSPGSFDTADRLGFGSYNGMNPNGIWTLYIADLSPGGQSRLENWSLGFSPVPEPVNMALPFLAGVYVVFILSRSRRVQNLFRRPPVPPG